MGDQQVNEVPISLAQYAKHRRVLPAAVTKAIDRGRLTEFSVVTVNGQRKIRDVALADREWVARASRIPEGVSTPPAITSSERFGVCREGGYILILSLDSEAPHTRH